MKYTIFNAQGQILAQSECSELEAVNLSALALPGAFEADAHYVDVATKTAIAKPIQPSFFHTFDYATKQWVDPRTVQGVKDAQWELIKSSREKTEYAGFTWDGSTFDSDQLSQQRIAGAVQLAMIAQAAGQPFSITWTLSNGDFRTLSGQEMMQVGLALGMHVQTQFAKGQTLQKQLADATTKETIETIVW